jgi:hypothetical protein
MKDVVDRIKGARAAKDMGAFLSHYRIERGEMMTTDGKITAGCPSPYDVTALVPGPELEALVARLEGDVAVQQDEKSLKLRAGRMHGTIQTLPADTVLFPRPEGDWLPPPSDLIPALRRVRSFISDQAVHQWGLCACLRTDAVLATNNISLVRAACPGLSSMTDVLLPGWAVDFVIGAKGKLTGIILNENHAGFQWDDGLWLRSQIVVGEFPINAARLLEEDVPTPVRITKEWKKAYQAVAGISEGIITVRPDRIVGGAGKSIVEHETPMDGLEQETHFNPKFLDNVIDVAESWDPSRYPSPIPFRAPGMYGLVLGRKQ